MSSFAPQLLTRLRQLIALCEKGIEQAQGVSDATAGFIFMGTPHPRNNDESLELHNRFLRTFAERSRQNQKMSNAEASQLTRLSMQFERLSHTSPVLTVYETQETRLGSWLRTKKLMVRLCGIYLNRHWLTVNVASRKKSRMYEFTTGAAPSHAGVAHRSLLHSA